MASTPLVTILMCTRNRGEAPLNAIKAVLATDYPALELLIVDQSDNDTTERAIRKLAGNDPRLRYLTVVTNGKAHAMNTGLAEARGEFIALTDDDCEPEPGWVSAFVQHMQSDEKLAVVFGEVVAVQHDPGSGYIPMQVQRETTTIARLRDMLLVKRNSHFGMGACAMVRKSAIDAVGGWDPCLCPGGRFKTGDDQDMAVRFLLAGYLVRFTPDARVHHYGFRPWTSYGNDLRNWGVASGAIFAKCLRERRIYFGPLRMVRYRMGSAFKDVVGGGRPTGLCFLTSWIQGFAGGLARPLDRPSRNFRA